jgi:hypothetical protein
VVRVLEWLAELFVDSVFEGLFEWLARVWKSSLGKIVLISIVILLVGLGTVALIRLLG